MDKSMHIACEHVSREGARAALNDVTHNDAMRGHMFYHMTSFARSSC